MGAYDLRRRGSEARYRRAVKWAIHDYTLAVVNLAREASEAERRGVGTGTMRSRADNAEKVAAMRRMMPRYERAAARARRILERLEAER